MGGRKGKALKPSDLKAKTGVKKEAAVKNSRKAAAARAKRGRAAPGEGPVAVPEEAKLVHPKSRRAKQLMRGFHNDTKKAAVRMVREKKEKAKQHRFRWFKQEVEKNLTFAPLSHLSQDALRMLIEKFVRRYDQELLELREKQSITKTYRASGPSGREKEILAIRSEEAQLAHTGDLEVPQLASKSGLRSIRQWDERLETLHTVPTTTLPLREVLPEPTATASPVSFSRVVQLKKKTAESKLRQDKRKKDPKVATAVDRTEERAAVQAAAVVAKREEVQAAKRAGNDIAEAPGDHTSHIPLPFGKKKAALQQARDKTRARVQQAAKSNPFVFKAPTPSGST